MPPSAGARKRARNIGEDAPEDEYCPEQAEPESNPATPKAKRKRTPKGKEMTVFVPPFYQSEKGYGVFTKMWWREVTQRNEFWEDFGDKVTAWTIQRRFKASVQPIQLVTTLGTKSTATPPRLADSLGSSGTRNKSKNGQPAVDSPEPLIPESSPGLEPATCVNCEQPTINGNIECDVCMQLHDYVEVAVGGGSNERATSETVPQQRPTEQIPTTARGQRILSVECVSSSSASNLNAVSCTVPSSRSIPKVRKAILSGGKLKFIDTEETIDVKVEQTR